MFPFPAKLFRFSNIEIGSNPMYQPSSRIKAMTFSNQAYRYLIYEFISYQSILGRCWLTSSSPFEKTKRTRDGTHPAQRLSWGRLERDRIEKLQHSALSLLSLCLGGLMMMASSQASQFRCLPTNYSAVMLPSWIPA